MCEILAIFEAYCCIYFICCYITLIKNILSQFFLYVCKYIGHGTCLIGKKYFSSVKFFNMLFQAIV